MPKRKKCENGENLSANLAQSVYERGLDKINDTFQTDVNAVNMKVLQKNRKSLESIIKSIQSY